MGMGEPLANYPRLAAALHRLTDKAPDGLGLSQRAITVSTVGLVPAIGRLADEGLNLTLAVSLHAPDDELRDTLVPVNTRWKVAEVLAAADAYAARTGRRYSIEYAMIRDVNDQPWRADLLGDLLAPRLAHVNLIPLNPTPGSAVGRLAQTGRARIRSPSGRARRRSHRPGHARSRDRRCLRAAGRSRISMRGAGGQLVGLLRDAARLDRTQSDPVVSLRNAVGVAAPLAIAIAAGVPSAGLPSTIGALQTGFADRPGPYRLRVLRMLGTALAAATTSGLAVLASTSNLGSAALILVLAFCAGLLLTAGPAATQVGTASVAAALIIGHIAQPPGNAFHIALLVFAGGAGQALLAVAAWPLRRHLPERLALAGLYRELAGMARRPQGPQTGPQAGPAIDTVRQTLYGLGHDYGPSVEAYRVLLDEAERIRREVIVLAALVERLTDDGDPVSAGLVRAALVAAGDVLDHVADALAEGRPIEHVTLAPARKSVRTASERLEAPGPSRGELTRRATAARLRKLAGQLRAVIETSTPGASEGGRPEVRDLISGLHLRDPIATLRANLTPDSAILRHAARTAVLVAGSDLVVRLAGYGRGYWVPLTVLVVLRPDFASTFQRAVMRVVGTVIGLLVATELLHWIPGGDWYYVALIGVFYFGVRFAGPGNLGLTAISLSGLVVVLLTVSGVPAHTTLVARSSDTAIGGALALVATLFFPLWERTLVPARLADLLGAYRAYLAALADPRSTLDERQRARAGARLARSNAQASVDRARAEPVTGRSAVELGEAVLANSHRVVHALMTVDSLRAALQEAGGAPELDALLHQAGLALHACEQAVRTSSAPHGAPSLRAAQEELHAFLTAHPERVGGVETAGAFADASDRLANAVDTLVSELRRQLGARAAVRSNA